LPKGGRLTLNEGLMARFFLGAELARLCARNKDGSFATQANRLSMLFKMGKDLQKAGFDNLSASSLKPKHVDALLARWNADGLAASTIKNRMAAVRWWAEKVGKQNCVPRTNDAAGIGRRTFVAVETKAQWLDSDQLAKINHERLRVSLELEQAFGLRREEALKFQPEYADKGDHLSLKGSWTKGGRPRDIPILNDYQREVLARVHELAGQGSMIPTDKSYKEWLATYEKATNRAGLRNLHGLRHGYAQRRFEELAGFKCPVDGGPKRDELTPEQKAADYAARMQVSSELGHGREDVTTNYLGR
jgi:integrase